MSISSSEFAWPEFGASGQLSTASQTPSPSRSPHVPGVLVAVAVGVLVLVAVAVAVRVFVAVATGVFVLVDVAVATAGVFVRVGVAVAAPGVFVLVGVAVATGVFVLVGVAVAAAGVFVLVDVAVATTGVFVLVGVAVAATGVFVRVGVAVAATGVFVRVGVAVAATGVFVRVGVAVAATGVFVRVGVAVGTTPPCTTLPPGHVMSIAQTRLGCGFAGTFMFDEPSLEMANVTVPLPFAVSVSVANNPGFAVSSMSGAENEALHTICAGLAATGNANPNDVQSQDVPRCVDPAPSFASGLSSSAGAAFATSGADTIPAGAPL